jgi:hypothetical protein
LTISERQIYYRLIALWVIIEAMMGGLIHTFKLPITGLILGGSAIIVIALIAHLVPHKGAILRATLIVAIFKMMMSPQAPPPAYIAVFFQGLLGELLFINKRFFRIACMLLAILTLLESAVQRVFVLTILMGEDLWKAINIFISGITGQDPTTNYSLYIVTAYILLHFIAGILIGRFMGNIPKLLITLERDKSSFKLLPLTEADRNPEYKKRKGRLNLILVLWITLIVLYTQSVLVPGDPWMSWQMAVQFLVRSILILITWIYILAPVLLYFLKKLLEKQKTIYKKDIEEILLLLPSTKVLFRRCWRTSGVKNGLGRLRLFWKLLFVNGIIHNES